MKSTCSILILILSAALYANGKNKKPKQVKPTVYFVKLFLKDGSFVKGKYIDTKDGVINLFSVAHKDTLHHSINIEDVKKVKSRRQGKFLVIAKWSGLCVASLGLIYGLTQIKSTGKSGNIPSTSPDSLIWGTIIIVAVFVYPFAELSTYFPKKQYPWKLSY
jgi:hypothetical protein